MAYLVIAYYSSGCMTPVHAGTEVRNNRPTTTTDQRLMDGLRKKCGERCRRGIWAVIALLISSPHPARARYTTGFGLHSLLSHLASPYFASAYSNPPRIWGKMHRTSWIRSRLEQDRNGHTNATHAKDLCWSKLMSKLTGWRCISLQTERRWVLQSLATKAPFSSFPSFLRRTHLLHRFPKTEHQVRFVLDRNESRFETDNVSVHVGSGVQDWLLYPTMQVSNSTKRDKRSRLLCQRATGSHRRYVYCC